MLSKIIRERRQALGWTQRRLAEAVGIPQPRISEIENGKNTNPKCKVLQAIAKSLQLEFLGEKVD